MSDLFIKDTGGVIAAALDRQATEYKRLITERDQRISDLEAQLAPVLDGTAFKMLNHKIALMMALLDRLPHQHTPDLTPHPDCSACEWKRLRDG